MAASDQYALNWSNHTSHIKKTLDSLLMAQDFVDVTLSCEGKKITAHKMLLSACSTYFHDLLRDNPCQHPIIILRDVKYQHLVDILKFIYNGEVSVAIDTFDSFLKTAEYLQISGLTDDEGQMTTGDRENGATTVESTHITFDEPQVCDIPPKKKDPVDTPPAKKSEKSKENKRKIVEKPVEQTKKRKENTVIKEEINPKKEMEEFDEDHTIDSWEENHDDSDSFVDVNSSAISQQSGRLQKFHDVQDLLVAKNTRGSQNKIHKLEERIGKLEASRSYCKGCFVKTRLGHISKDKIKQVNTFCTGCEGLPNYCKSCYKTYHKNEKNKV